jgi:predicted ATPase/DNA-binding CsgD family transcriptional regulator
MSSTTNNDDDDLHSAASDPRSARDPRPLHALNRPPNNLPLALTSFIGRDREVAEIKRLLDSTRLLTLSGPGGCGKTRLALQVATDLAEAFVDGVWWVELAALADADLVPQVVAMALDVREAAGQSFTETLCNYLRPRHVLLVLDNCEHLIAACAHLAEALLQTCPNLRLLATSREALGITAETTWLVPSLTLPDAHHLPSLEELMRYEAVRLFAERAAAALPSFRLTEQNVAAVVQVCRRLDGIPLAIELAAARVKVLTAAQIAERLDDCFRLLTTGSRTALPRHQTLRATIDWSYELLSDQERMLFYRLSVFAGGWTLEAVEAVCAGAGVEQENILDLLSRLLDKSLVIMHEHGATARYRLLETVRQYGAEKLLQARESNVVRQHHADFFLQLAEALEPTINSRERTAVLAVLEEDHDNLRAALHWALETRDVGLSLRLAGALWWFWFHRGYWSEGHGWLEAALAMAGACAPTAAQAKVLLGTGLIAFAQVDHSTARMRLQESAAIYREQSDRAGLAYALAMLVVPMVHQGDSAAARPHAEEAVALLREVGDAWGLAIALTNLGIVPESQKDYAEAKVLFEESVALFRDLGDPWGLSLALRHLGYVFSGEGNYARAAALFKESLVLCGALGEKWFSSMCLEDLGVVAGMGGDYRRAVRLLAASAVLREVVGTAVRNLYRADYDRTLAAARAGLDERAFAAAWDEGRAMTLEQAIVEAQQAMAPDQAIQSPRPPMEPPSPAYPAGLTAREVEVLRLVAQGLTNAQVAEQLVITPRTVNVHLTSIYSKLQVTSRTAAARYAIEHHLI